jgi:hypothetical protein
MAAQMYVSNYGGSFLWRSRYMGEAANFLSLVCDVMEHGRFVGLLFDWNLRQELI